MKLDHNNNFDLIRLLAALQVVQYHATGALQIPVPEPLAFVFAQFPGVPVFFVVSGFLVTRSYLYGSGGVAAYFARRALRIYPALWVSTSLIVLALAATGSLANNMVGPKLGAWLATSFSMGSEIVGNFLVGKITQPGGFYPSYPSGVTWTLIVELSFYVFLPVILLGKFTDKRLAWMSLAFWAVTSLLVSRYYIHLDTVAPEGTLTKLLSVNLFVDLWEFLLGAACSIYWERVRHCFERRFLWWLAIYLFAALLLKAFLGVNGLNTHKGTPLMPLMTALMACVVISFAFTWRNAASVLGGNDFSYGIYLYHLPIIVTLTLMGVTGHQSIWLIVLGTTFTLAAMSWYLVERPSLQLKARTGRWLSRFAQYWPSLQRRRS
jgi:peptidoglycan/LPS O-acetylase OafA/YrhL